MPQYAREALTQRMERSGLLDRLRQDVRMLFRKRLHFDSPETQRTGEWVCTPLQVGAVTLGYLSLPASQSNERNVAYRHWLEMACQVFAQELGSPHPHATDVLPAKVRRAAQLIRERAGEPVSLGEIAASVELSRERLSRLFHETLGITFSDYLNEVRLGEARRYLAQRTGTITEIAYASGFQSLSQFNRRFRQSEGISPSQYRKRHLQSADRID
jgi:AraC-like DNA-binding protein